MNEGFLSYAEWQEQFGKQYVSPKYRSKSVRGVDVNRCQKIASGKNTKIKEENFLGYSKYLEEYSLNNNLSQLCGEDKFGSDRLRGLAQWLTTNNQMERAEDLLFKSGKYTKNEFGKWVEKSK
jgi:hypothetical protein